MPIKYLDRRDILAAFSSIFLNGLGGQVTPCFEDFISFSSDAEEMHE